MRTLQEIVNTLSSHKGSMFIRYIVAILFIGIFYQSGYSQDYKRIQVSDDIELIKLSENIFVHVSYASLPGFGRFPSNGVIFRNGNEAFLFDTPVTDYLTEVLVTWLQDSLNLNIVGFVPNHWHEDCMGGLRYLQNQKIPSYANQMTIDIARSNNLPAPAQGFSDSLPLYLADKRVECYYPGAAHSLDNIVIWIPSEQVLFAGCMVKSINSTDLGNTADGDLKAYPATIQYLLDRFPDAKTVIPGHGPFGGFELLEHTKKLSHK
jgi:metallo-beta-lactamase class B